MTLLWGQNCEDSREGDQISWFTAFMIVQILFSRFPQLTVVNFNFGFFQTNVALFKNTSSVIFNLIKKEIRRWPSTNTTHGGFLLLHFYPSFWWSCTTALTAAPPTGLHTTKKLVYNFDVWSSTGCSSLSSFFYDKQVSSSPVCASPSFFFLKCLSTTCCHSPVC